jgi:mRNA interferase YafQ
MEKRHKNMNKIYEIISFLIWDELLPERSHEHRLSGSYERLTECHIESDWVMIYRKSDEKIVFYYTGTHSDYL